MLPSKVTIVNLQVYSKVASSTREDVLSAIAAAQRAQPLWERKTMSERAAVMRRVADILEERLEGTRLTTHYTHFSGVKRPERLINIYP